MLTQVSIAFVSMKFRNHLSSRKLHIMVGFPYFFVYLVLNLDHNDFHFCGASVPRCNWLISVSIGAR